MVDAVRVIRDMFRKQWNARPQRAIIRLFFFILSKKKSY